MNMAFLESLAAHPIVTSIGWTLVHFVWQAILIGVVTALALGIMRQSSASLRYAVACAGLAVMTTAPGVTLAFLIATSNPVDWNANSRMASNTQPIEDRSVQVVSKSYSADLINPTELSPNGLATGEPKGPQPFAGEGNAEAGSITAVIISGMERIAGTMQGWLPWLVALWIAGVACLSVRMTIGLRRVWRWRSEGADIVAVEIVDSVSRLARRMNLRRLIRLQETARATVPAVIGWIKPAILIPASMLSGLTTAEFDSILAHELAHVRRHDYVVNLLQTIVETILFYHPAVWWISTRIRMERENCCDDIAVEVCGNRVVFAQALARMEEIRCRPEHLAVAANGGTLLGRIRRIVGNEPAISGSWWPAGAIVLGSLGSLLGGLWMTTATANPKTRQLVYESRPLKTGEEIGLFSVGETRPDQEPGVDADEKLIFNTIESDGDRVSRVAINAFGHGRSAAELVRHFSAIDHDIDISKFQSGVSTTNMESIVSAVDFNYVFDSRIDVAEVIFNLPEGSGMRAEFHGEKVDITTGADSTTVVITGGRIELIDAGGVIRAWASPDGGAEQLVIECREALGEVVMKTTTRRIEPFPDFPVPPVQVVLNTNTGAPENEGDPPHGAIRYEIQQGEDKGHPFMRMKMKWRYEMKRLLDEAVAESGMAVEELIYGKADDDNRSSPPKPLPPERKQLMTPTLQEDVPWGDMAHDSGIRLRLTLLTEKPVVGQPLLFKLEVRNFGEKPTGVDAQNYAPFRVLRAVQADGNSAPFIGMTPQTSGSEQSLKPGDSLTLWENVDAIGLFLLESGKYTFLAEGGEWAEQARWRDSNSLDVEIAAGEPTPLNKLLKNLSQGIPEQWELSSAMGIAGGWKGIYLTHVPSGLKRDATGIQIWFTDEKLADDFELGKGDQKQIVTQLGKCEFGFMNVAAQPQAPEIWPNYLDHVRKAATEALNFEENGESEKDNARQAEKLPWIAVGRVTGTDGAPIEGAIVRAHCGMGTLRETGSAKTDGDGKYELRFGPGIRFENNAGIQAATISVHLDGFTEINMHRQGDLVAAFELPAGGNIGWGGKTEDKLFLPRQQKEINFTMVPAVTVRGMVIDQNGNHPEGVRVSITGEELPPSSSVIAEVRTNDKGEFEIGGIPPGYKFQIMVEPAEAEPPWLAWASAPVVFRYGASETGLEYEIDGNPVDFTCQHLYLMLHGDGVNWKTALKEAADNDLQLTWDGLSTDKMVRAGMAFLELGAKKE